MESMEAIEEQKMQFADEAVSEEDRQEETKGGTEDVPQTEKKGFLHNNAGVGVVEIILILVVLVALVVIFKDQLTGMVEKAMSALEKSMDGILS